MSKVDSSKSKHPIAQHLAGQMCAVGGCGFPAAHQLVGVAGDATPTPVTTAKRVCCGHYAQVVGKQATECGETGVDRATVAYGMVQSALGMLAGAAADSESARNYVALTVEGMPVPFDRAIIELVRPGGMHSAEAVAELQRWRRSIAVTIAEIADRVAEDVHYTGEEARADLLAVLARFGEVVPA